MLQRVWVWWRIPPMHLGRLGFGPLISALEFAAEIDDHPRQMRPVGVVPGQRLQLLNKIGQHGLSLMRTTIIVTYLEPQPFIVGPKPHQLAEHGALLTFFKGERL